MHTDFSREITDMDKSNRLMMILSFSSVPALAFSVSLDVALGLGIYTLIALALTTAISYPLLKTVSKKASVAVALLVSVVVVSALMMILEAFRGGIYSGNGTYFALAAVSALILSAFTREEEKSFSATLSSSLLTGSEWLIALAFTALIRETIGKGTIMGNEIAFLTPYRITLISKPFGGFVIYALVTAAVVAIDRKGEKK